MRCECAGAFRSEMANLYVIQTEPFSYAGSRVTEPCPFDSPEPRVLRTLRDNRPQGPNQTRRNLLQKILSKSESYFAATS